ncbi:hypothetical protein M896_091670 [Ordospora colligata OC4]|uniref:Ricin B lectin domain-containing protein n=1 Tax=Ordospora colligata OC4 TaxID=1354746 RepID=A0A0B2UJ66_9MICR|nr:uncharacterized protein M896_091670 [Ordospora colligata OC4]KHN69239.1 hypothetical protein M896_091670 [Ordospora colligata OC4]TBU14517.1 hypothetical protein CWI40_091630 [Ordospora colligata]TBU14694.1 hypothetical protein CWI41_091660 [Ordospora colligata]
MRPVFLNIIVTIGIVIADEEGPFKIASKLDPTKFFSGGYSMEDRRIVMSNTMPALEFVKIPVGNSATRFTIQEVNTKDYLDIESNINKLVIWKTATPEINQRIFMFPRTQIKDTGFMIVSFKNDYTSSEECLQYNEDTGNITRERCDGNNPRQKFLFDRDIPVNEMNQRMLLNHEPYCPYGDPSKCGKPSVIIINKTSDPASHSHSHASSHLPRLSRSHEHLLHNRDDYHHEDNHFPHFNFLTSKY